MSNRKAVLFALAGAFLLLGGVTRFARIGWSFSGDETTMFTSVDSLVQDPFFPDKMQRYMVQGRTHTVGCVLQALTYRVFGRSESGARTGVALAGTIAIALAVVLTYRIYGLATAVVVGVLLVLNPWHLSHSQTNRNYSYAFLFGSLALLTGMVAWRENKARWAVASAICSALAVSCHNLTIVIPVAFGLYTLGNRTLGRGDLPKRALAGYLLFGVPLLGASSVLAVLAMRGWSEVGSGYTSAHSVMALAYNMVWGVAALAAVGWVIAWRSGRPEDGIAATVAALAVLECAAIPLVSSFRHDYVYPVSLAFILLASRALARLYETVRPHNRLLAAGIVVAVLALPLPSFASHYADGGKKDYRGAAKYIAEHTRKGDVVAADSNALLAFYLRRDVLPIERPSVNPKKCIEALTELKATGSRIWYVCRYAREEPARWADQWLWRNAVRHVRLKRERFDYHENIVDVYLINEGSIAAASSPSQ